MAAPDDQTLTTTVDQVLVECMGENSHWTSIFDDHAVTLLRQTLADVLEAENGLVDRIQPPPQLILNAFRFLRPADVRVVLVGQDPYPTAGDAMGLSFSVPPGRPIPKSLQSIWDCVQNNGSTPSCRSGDLRAWAIQGVLMLNVTLTTRVGVSKSHSQIWKQYGFVPYIVQRIIDSVAPRKLPFLAWGNDAKTFASSFSEQPVFRWTHPSPLADNQMPEARKFRNCTNFRQCNEYLVEHSIGNPIVWNNMLPTIIFTDGARVGLTRGDPEASFAVYMMSGVAKLTMLVGRVEPFAYRVVDEWLEADCGGEVIMPTNNRAECLAGCFAMLIALRTFACGPVSILSDSKYFVESLNTWIEQRKHKIRAAGPPKNPDILDIMVELKTELEQKCTSLKFIHVPAHQETPVWDTISPAERVKFVGNARADRLATKHLVTTDSDDMSVCVETIMPLSFPPSVRLCDHLVSLSYNPAHDYGR
jgi:uracil-DNA glycosylase